MTAKELQKRNGKADSLRVLQTDDAQFYVESGEGKILYNVTFDDKGDTCTCGDFAKNIKRDKGYHCKHIIAVYNAIPNQTVESACFLERSAPKLNERWITKIEGKEFVKYPGLLDLGHQKGISSIEVEIVQMPTKENDNFAVCRAVVMSKTGETYSDIGDASPSNCSSKVSRHLLRMASTRAIARALRSYTNVGMTALEELADFNEPITQGGKQNDKRPTSKSTAKAPKKTTAGTDQKPTAKKETPKPNPADNSDSGQPKMSEAQKRAIYNLSRRRGISVEEVETLAVETYGIELSNLTSADAATFIRTLQQAA